MKGLNFVFFGFLFLTSNLLAKESIDYTLNMPEPHSHYFEVEMVLKNFKENHVELIMPVWAPGSYLIREFPKNVDFINGFNSEGKSLNIYKTNKYTWRVENDQSGAITIRYKVYAFEMSIRTSYLDIDHGYINGTSVFMYVNGYKDLPLTLTINPYEEWKIISTGLPRNGNKKWNYSAENYDQLADCPIEMGNHKEIKFEAAGIPHTVAMFGEGNYDEEKIKKDFTRIIEKCTEVFGSNPNKEFLFIIHNVEKSGGGLEHMNSTTIQIPRWNYASEQSYESFLTTVTHEYIHVWLVKRIRPDVLGPYDYTKENHTDQLWIMEGFTSYLSQLLLCQLGYIENHEFLNFLGDRISNMETSPANSVQSVSEASFDAWIKSYIPDENSGNTNTSYYVKGSVLANLIDLLIIDHSDAKQDLGDALKYLYDNYYLKNGKGISSIELKKVFEKFTGTNLDAFYDQYVDGTAEIDYAKHLGLAGIIVEKKYFKEDLKLGIRTKEEEGKINISSVSVGSPAWKYGIYADDEIIAVDGNRVSQRSIGGIVKNKKPDDVIEVIISRDGLVRTIDVALHQEESFYYMFSLDPSRSKKTEEVMRKWLDD